MKKELFLRNQKNKQRFISLLSKKLQDNGYSVSTSFDSTIVMMANVAAESSKTSDTVVVGKQADLLVVLIFFAFSDKCRIFYMYEETTKKPLQIFQITEMREKLGEVQSRHLLFVQAMSGSKTTSQMFNISKGTLLNKLGNENFSKIAEIFCSSDSTRESIIKAGKDLIVSLYNGKANETLNKLRYRKFIEKTQRGALTVSCKALPPTEAAANFHCLRVFHTVQEWMGHKLNPLNYGYIERNCILRPVATNIPPAPAEILSNIRCGCQGDCNSNRCTCYKVGLKCSTACKVCAGSSCSNHSPFAEDSDSDDNE